MKTITYFLIISLIAVTMSSAVQKTSVNDRSVILQANKNASLSSLQESSKIISDRLKAYGLTSFNLNVMGEKEQIKIDLPGHIELKEIEGLLLSRGDLSFYETLTLDGIADYLKNDQRFSPRDAIIGCATSENASMVEKVQEYLNAKSLSTICKLAWKTKKDKNQTCLYSLKINKDGNPLMRRSDIESVKASRDKNSQFLIQIKFKAESASAWKEATRENLNKPIAIVIDDRLFYDPVVRTPMENGLCEISGDFTQNEVNYFLAIVNNGQLPLSLSLLK